jgi:hypothetical protein
MKSETFEETSDATVFENEWCCSLIQRGGRAVRADLFDFEDSSVC